MLGAALQLVTGIFSRKHERAQAKHEAEVRQIEAGASERANGWKDEFALVVIVLPFLFSFIPFTADYIAIGFHNLKTNTPEWYQYLFVGGITSALGIQGIQKFRK